MDHLHQQVRQLGDDIGLIIKESASEEVFELIEELRHLARDEANYAKALKRIESLSNEEIHWLVRSFTLYFNLINQAENQEIIRKNQERSIQASVETPRSESVFDAIYTMKAQGFSLEQVLDCLKSLDIQPTLTAHPTETKRQSVLQKLREVSDLLHELNHRKLSEFDRDELNQKLYQAIALLAFTSSVRTQKLTIQDEIHNGLFFLRKTIWRTLPTLYRDLRAAIRYYYGENVDDFPTIYHYRSWIGGDCDGNPFVTPDVVEHALNQHHEAALKNHISQLKKLWRELSISSGLLSVPQYLHDSIERDQAEVKFDDAMVEFYSEEPFRLKISYMMARLKVKLTSLINKNDSPGYADHYEVREFIADLTLLRKALCDVGLNSVAEEGLFYDIWVQAKSFGFYLAALDVRQHSDVHEQTITEILKSADVCDDYAALNEQQKLDLLLSELSESKVHYHKKMELSEKASNVMQTMDVVKRHIGLGRHVIGQYVISMTHAVSDMLEVLFLAKEAGIWVCADGEVMCPLQIAPLLETVDDLNNAENLLEVLFSNDLYQKHLHNHHHFQEIMLGYSDSNKDGGYLMANWMQYNAQANISKLCERHNIDFRLFHGRGGSIGRGGGRANKAIFAQPHEACNGRIRMTEQGEIISFRYSSPQLAHRHLEQMFHAMLITTMNYKQGICGSRDIESGDLKESFDKIANLSMKAYRDLIDDPKFWSWYINITPIRYISKLPIASRPVSRKAADEVDFDGLRAIPWVFSWTQARFNAPGWYGIGAALNDLFEGDDKQFDEFKNLYKQSTFFNMVINNAERELARANLNIAKFYCEFSETNLFDKIKKDFDLAKKWVLALTGQSEFLDNTPVIQASLKVRSPYAAVLHFLQLELIKRIGKTEDQAYLNHLVLHSINGLAAAMQSTG